MIDDDLDTSIRQVGRLLGNIYWLVRKIVNEKIGYKSTSIEGASLLAMQ